MEERASGIKTFLETLAHRKTTNRKSEMKNLGTIVSKQLFARTINNILLAKQLAYFLFYAEISIYVNMA